MNEHEMPELSPEFDQALHAYYQSPGPAPAFISRLERDLRNQHAALIEAQKSRDGALRHFWGRFVRLLRMPSWQTVAIVVLLALAITTLVIGPSRVLAQVQQWLGYVPGFGFVDLDRARVLAEPVGASQEGVTLQVEQLLAEPDRTRLIFSAQGFPPQRGSWLDQGSQMTAYLRLPDGKRHKTKFYGTSISQGTKLTAKLEFPAMPEDVYQVTLEIDRLPYLPSGAAPENWEILLALRPASRDLPEDRFPPSFTPADASASVNGITVRILQVASSPAETALQVQFEWQHPDWEWWGTPVYTLRDDVGHGYEFPRLTSGSVEEVVQVPPGPSPTSALTIQTARQTYQFAPLSQAANQATFTLEEVGFSLPANAFFTFDPGPDPLPGKIWSIDKWLEIAGFKLHFTEARLFEETPNNPEKEGPVYIFEFPFEVEQLPPQEANEEHKLDMIEIDADNLSISESSSAGSWRTGKYQFTLGFEELPEGPISIQIDSILISVPGPWEISWQIPKLSDVRPQIRTLYPENATGTQAGITLQVEKMILSDRLSVVDLSVPDLPPGIDLLRVSPADPRMEFIFRKGEVSLHDQSGQPLEPYPDVRWLVGGEPTMAYDPDNLEFAPVDPATTSLILDIPGVELLIPGKASFDLTLPEGLEVKMENYVVKLPQDFYPETERTLTRWASQRWAVDISLDIAGFKLHFDHAHLERKGRLSDRHYQLVLTGDPLLDYQNGRWLNQLHLASISRPDGTIGTASGGVRIQPIAADQREAQLTIDVTTQEGNQPLPGRYRLDLDGVTVWVPGPWELDIPQVP